jgi:hypothetical protein
VQRVVLVALLVVALSGCAAFPAESPRATAATHADLPGLNLVATLHSDGASHRIVATAWNDGPSTFHVRSVCPSPWSTRMAEADGRAFVTGPQRLHCVVDEWAAMEPRHATRHTAWWNQTRWDEEHRVAASAAPGLYTWEIHFTAHAQENGTAHTLTASFRLRAR